LDNSTTGGIADSWDLLTKAENRCKLGLISEAVIAADEAIEAALRTCFDKLGSPLPSDRKEALRVLRGEGVKVPAQSVLHIGELRKRAERSTEKEDVSPSEAEEAISTAESLLTEINEKQFHHAIRERETEFILPVNTPGLVQPFRPLHESIAQVEPEFVTKLLLARAILNTRKKRVPHLIGMTVTVLSALTCSLFGLLGAVGVILSFTGSSFFSIFGLVFDFALLLIAYLFLKIAVYVKGETR
jgi:HEPN domain-containing protein